MNLGEYAASQANIFQLIANVPIDATQTRQLYFPDGAARDAYFQSKVVAASSNTNFKFIRKNRAIKVQANENTIENCNYMRFKNTGGQWWYAFVTNIEYVNPNTSLVYFKIDVFQTYFYQASFRQCDIAREHTENQTLWQNTVSESLDYGDYTIVDTSFISFDVKGYMIVSTVNLGASGTDAKGNPRIVAARGGTFNRAPSACNYYLVADYDNVHTDSLYDVLQAIAQFPWVAQCIIGVYAVPRDVVEGAGGDYVTIGDATLLQMSGSGNRGTYNRVYTEYGWQSKFPAYTAKKLLTYPFSFIEVVTPDGNNEIIKPELIGENEIDLEFICRTIFNPLVTWDVKLLGYAGSANKDRQFQTLVSSSGASYPVQNNQYYASKLTEENQYRLIRSQNAENLRIGEQYINTNLAYSELHHGIDLAGQAANVFDPTSWISTGGVSGNIAGMAHTGLTMAQEYDVSRQQIETNNRMEQQAAARDRQKIDSNQNAVSMSGTTAAGNNPIDLAAENFNLILRYWTVKPEFRSRLEQYFSAFGYRSERIGTPNFTIGNRYHYIRCNSVNIYGDIPNLYLNELQNIFLDGVTLWKDHENVGVYGNN